MKNPFIAGNWVRGDRFFGRAQLLNDILEGKYSYLWVAGTRRFGKTSLLKQLEFLCDQPPYDARFVPLFWNMQGAADVAGLTESLLESVEDAEERFAGCDVLPGELADKELFEMLRALKRGAKAAHRILLLLCDECEELLNIEAEHPEILPRLRRFFQQGENVITVISATKRLLKLEAGSQLPTSPFLHGFTPPVYLQALEEAAADRLIGQGGFSAAEVAEIKEKCARHPYLTQLLCSRLYEKRDLPAVIQDLTHDEMVGHFFGVDFDYLESNEKIILWHVLNAGTLTVEELSRKTAIQADNLAMTLYSLIQLGYLRQQGEQLALANYFFEKWLKREKDRLFERLLPLAMSAAPDVPVPADAGVQSSFAGRVVSHYRIEKELGKGGMGWVFQAQDIRLERAVALKLLSPTLWQDSQARERFLIEARASAALNHPNIATVYEVDEAEGLLFIAMELIDGQPLGKWREAHPADLPALLRVARQICDAVLHAHAHNVIHRDLKPDNIMVTTGEERVKIMDFGLAKILKSSREKLTHTGAAMGTPAYMAPEQISGGSTDYRTDIFALGVVLFELFTGTRPFSAPNQAALFYAIMHEPPRPVTELNPNLPAGLVALLEKMLIKAPEQRLQNLSELLDQLPAPV